MAGRGISGQIKSRTMEGALMDEQISRNGGTEMAMPIKTSQDTYDANSIAIYIAAAARMCHEVSSDAGWWNDLKTGEALERNAGELMMLMVSEIAEAMEAHRKKLRDDKLPQFDGVTVELADAVIRIFDFAAAHDLPLGLALVKKVEFNQQRADHKPENRRKPGGKAY
jgi:NTP pyrophosphatase (non-canonical NTP hydrolase)